MPVALGRQASVGQMDGSENFSDNTQRLIDELAGYFYLQALQGTVRGLSDRPVRTTLTARRVSAAVPSVSAVFNDYVQAMPTADRATVTNWIMKGPQPDMASFGAFASVDVNSRAYVATQVEDSLLSWVTLDILEQVGSEIHNQIGGAVTGGPASTSRAGGGSRIGMAPGTAVALPGTHRSLSLRLLDIECVKETRESWLPGWGSDEIYIGGTASLNAGDQIIIGETKLGDFDEGDSKVFQPPKDLVTFSSLDQAQYPVTAIAIFTIAEHDDGKFADFVRDLVAAADLDAEKILEKIVTALGGAIGTAIGGPFGAIIGAIAGAAIAKVIKWFIGLFKDDIFDLRTLAISLGDRTTRFNGQALTTQTTAIQWKQYNADYRLSFDWSLDVVPQQVVA